MLNAAGLYFLSQALYIIYVDRTKWRSAAVIGPLYVMYQKRDQAQSYMSSSCAVGIDDDNIYPLFISYCSCQLVQTLVGHSGHEKKSQFNLYHLFFLQQYLTLLELYMTVFGLFSQLKTDVDEIVPYYKEKETCIANTMDGVHTPALALLLGLHKTFQNVFPHYSAFDVEFLSFFPLLQNIVALLGLIQIVVHRTILEKLNLLKAPQDDVNKSWVAHRKCPFGEIFFDCFLT